MSADYERKLHRAVAQFVKEADKKYPNWSERNDNGEWGIGLDKFDDMYKVILEIIEYTSCDEATEQMLDDILFGIARDNECSRIIEVLLKYPDWYALPELSCVICTNKNVRMNISWSLMLQLINLMRPIVMMTIPKVEYPLCQN